MDQYRGLHECMISLGKGIRYRRELDQIIRREIRCSRHYIGRYRKRIRIEKFEKLEGYLGLDVI